MWLEDTGGEPNIQGRTENPSRNRTKWIAANFIIIGLIGAITFVVAISPALPRCPPVEQINILYVTFGATAGHVTFPLGNDGTGSVTIVQAFARGAGITGEASTSLSTGNIVPPGNTISHPFYLNVTFFGVIFQSGATYYFTLLTACGNHLPIATTA